MSHRRITLKADYPVKAGTYEQKTPPKRQDRRTPAWAIQEEAARHQEMIRLAEIPIWKQYRHQVQSESLRARKEYYGEAYGTMVVPEFEAHVKSWEQQQYASLSTQLATWRTTAIQAMIPKVEKTVVPVAPKGVVGGYTVERDPLAISKGFYTDIGYPQYAGKYDPFLTPEGYTIKAITETETGLQVSFESTTPKSISQRILEFDIPTYFADVMGFKGEKRLKYLGITSTLTSPIHVLPKPFGTPVESLAGLVSYPETLSYAGMTLIGVEPPTRPPPPPGISEGFTMGYAMGMIGTSLVMGKLIEISPLGKPLAKLEMGIMSKIREPIIGTRLDKLLLKHSGYWATLQEYKAGTVVFGGAPKKWSPFRYRGKTITPMSVTLKKAIADTSGSVLLPRLLTTPKTLFTLPKTALPGAFMPQIIGATTVLGLETLQLPKLTTTQKTRVHGKKISRLKESTKQFSLSTPKMLEFTIPTFDLLSKQKQPSMRIPKLSQIQTPLQIPRQIQRQPQIQKQMQKQMQGLIQIQMQTLEPLHKMPFDIVPKKRKRKKLPSRKKGKTGRYKRQYPLMTAKQILEVMVG